jgi:hypothetical protein
MSWSIRKGDRTFSKGKKEVDKVKKTDDDKEVKKIA